MTIKSYLLSLDTVQQHSPSSQTPPNFRSTVHSARLSAVVEALHQRALCSGALAAGERLQLLLVPDEDHVLERPACRDKQAGHVHLTQPRSFVDNDGGDVLRRGVLAHVADHLCFAAARRSLDQANSRLKPVEQRSKLLCIGIPRVPSRPVCGDCGILPANELPVAVLLRDPSRKCGTPFSRFWEDKDKEDKDERDEFDEDV